MRKIILALAISALCVEALAELQNVDVQGQIRIRGRYWDNLYSDNGLEVRIPDFFLPNRPIGPFGTGSRYRYDDHSNKRTIVERSTKLGFSADFTNYVKAVIEFDDAGTWGDGDFRSDYITGIDSRANSRDDVEVINAYIQTDETFGIPLRLRIGRQQIKLGSGWLVGETQNVIEQAFDGVRATYTGEGYAIDGWWTKIAETGINEEDGDVDFYGLSATCTALEGHTFLAYWLYLRDARSINDTNFVAPIERLEDLFELDDYDATNLHTVGLRANGVILGADYAAEIAYQFGEADSVGTLFKPLNFLYGDDGATYNNWAGDVEIGYAFEVVMWAPRPYIGAVYIGGEDNRDISFAEWLNPFDKPEASVSFNRLFGSQRYFDMWDEGRGASNWYGFRAGVGLKPTQAISLDFQLSKLNILEEFDRPLMVGLGNWQIPVAPALPFLTEESGAEIGYVAQLTIDYNYSEELLFRFVASQLFANGDVNDGNFAFQNGLEFVGGTDDDDILYLSLESRLKF